MEEIREGQQQQWSFKHVPSEIGAMESEEVGNTYRSKYRPDACEIGAMESEEVWNTYRSPP